MVNPYRFYTYAYLREDRTPYYIGKGTDSRLYIKSGRKIKPPKDKSKIIFLKKNLTEEEAFRHEIYMIALFGRKDLGTGILYNLTDGGEGMSGIVMSDETKKKIGIAGRGRTHSKESRKKISEKQKGKYISDESRLKMSESQKGKKLTEKTKEKIGIAGRGRTHSEEIKQKLRNLNKGKTLTKEHRKKLSEAHKGKTLTEEHKKKIAEAHKGKTFTKERIEKLKAAASSKRQEVRKKIGDANKNRKWWNDGCGNLKFVRECPGVGWFPGIKNTSP
jgi:hypothetical protein